MGSAHRQSPVTKSSQPTLPAPPPLCRPSRLPRPGAPPRPASPRPQARTKLSARPWRVDCFDEFAEVWFSKSELDEEGQGEAGRAGRLFCC